jgi:hypothetical protein
MPTMPGRAVTRSVVLAFATLAASVSIAPAVAAPGGGEHRPPDDCVTLREYTRAHAPMSRKAVHRLFDTAGVRTSITDSGARTNEVRSYDVCKSPDSTVTVTYEKRGKRPFRLMSKTAVFV